MFRSIFAVAFVLSAQSLPANEKEEREKALLSIKAEYKRVYKIREEAVEARTVDVAKAKTPTAKAAAMKALTKAEADLDALRSDPLKHISPDFFDIRWMWDKSINEGKIVRLKHTFTIEEPFSERTGATVLSTLLTTTTNTGKKLEQVVKVEFMDRITGKPGEKVEIKNWYEITRRSDLDTLKKTATLRPIEWTPAEIAGISAK